MVSATNEPESQNKLPDEKAAKRNAWAEDQEKHRYYYDDAHGYEKYEPDADDDEEDECKDET